MNQHKYDDVKRKIANTKNELAQITQSIDKLLPQFKALDNEIKSLMPKHELLILEHIAFLNFSREKTTSYTTPTDINIIKKIDLMDKLEKKIIPKEKIKSDLTTEILKLNTKLEELEKCAVISENRVKNFENKNNISDKEFLNFFVQYSKFDEAYKLFLNFWSKPKEAGINSFLLKILEVAAWRNHDAFDHLLKLSTLYQLDNNISILKTFRIFKMHGVLKRNSSNKPLLFADNILQKIMSRLLKDQINTPVHPQSNTPHSVTDYTNIWQAFAGNESYEDIQDMINKVRHCCDKNNTWLILSLNFLETINHLEREKDMAFPDDVMTTYLRWLYEPDVVQRKVLMTKLQQLMPYDLPEDISNLELPVEAVLDVAIASSDENSVEALRLVGLALQLTAKYQKLPIDSPLLSKVVANRYLWGNQKALFSLALFLSDEPEYKTLSQQLMNLLVISDFRKKRYSLMIPEIWEYVQSIGSISTLWRQKKISLLPRKSRKSQTTLCIHIWTPYVLTA